MRNTLLYFLAALVIFPVMAQQQPEWQSQYAVGLNKLAPHTYVSVSYTHLTLPTN